MFKSQLEIVRDKLLEDGEITRRWATHKAPRENPRLAARIKNLRDAGWNIEGKDVKDERGHVIDFQYYMVGKGK